HENFSFITCRRLASVGVNDGDLHEVSTSGKGATRRSNAERRIGNGLIRILVIRSRIKRDEIRVVESNFEGSRGPEGRNVIPVRKAPTERGIVVLAEISEVTPVIKGVRFDRAEICEIQIRVKRPDWCRSAGTHPVIRNAETRHESLRS